MKFFNEAQQAAQDILAAFQNPTSLPAPLAHVFIHRKDGTPCRAWSWRNQLIVALRGHSDARGFRQWEEVGRQVKRGEKAFRILSPVWAKKTDEKTGEMRFFITGFKGTPVFGFDQTEGEPPPASDPTAERWLDKLPLREVAEAWGVSVEVFNGRGANCLGSFRPHWNAKGIALGVKNLSTWTHELVHAADHRNGKLTELGQHWRSETVAELGGAVVLKLLGLDHDADLGGCWEYVQRYARKQGIEVLDACGKVLERTCEAVALILDTAEAILSEANGEDTGLLAVGRQQNERSHADGRE
jgi:hypothetical protein